MSGLFEIKQAIDFNELKELDNFKDIKEYRYNPFTRNFKFNVKEYYDKVADKVNNNSTQNEEHTITINNFLEEKELILAKELFMDTANFCKVIGDHKMFRTGDLSPSACKLFLYIIAECTHDNLDFIILNPKLTSERLNLSQATVYKCITELVKNILISKKADENNIYWINPYIFFRGDRKKIKYRKI